MVQTGIPLDDDWDDAKTNSFFTTQMKLDAVVFTHLKNDGIEGILDLEDLNADSLSSIRTQTNKDATVTKHFGDHSYRRLCVAASAVRYHVAIKRQIDPDIFKWAMLKNFSEGMKSLKALKAQPSPSVPKLKAGSFTPIKWAPSFIQAMRQHWASFDDLAVPLSYVLRDTAVPAADGDIDGVWGYAIEYGSYLDELEARIPHTCASYRMDNEVVWAKLDEATRGTPYAPTVAACQSKAKGKDGRKAFFAILTQHMGDDKWANEVKKHESVLRELKWKGTGSQTLEKYFATLRNAYQGLVTASEHIEVQVPTDKTRVGFMLDNIVTTDSRLSAVIANILADKTGMRVNFETAAAALQECCPVANKTTNAKRNAAEISAATGVTFDEASIAATTGSVPLKKGIGTTGVHLRYHEPGEWRALKSDQKKELSAWRKTPEGIVETARSKAEMEKNKKRKTQSQKDKQKAKISAAVAEELKAQISAMLADDAPAPAPAPTPVPAALMAQPIITPAMLRAALAAQVKSVQVEDAGPPSVPNPPAVPQPPQGAVPNPWIALPGILKKAKNAKPPPQYPPPT